jgi:hypothetical protein
MATDYSSFSSLTLASALKLREADSGEDLNLIRELSYRIESVRTEMDLFRETCDRFDKLYYSEEFTLGGADLWATHPSATTPGRSHVSVNTPSTYVDIPASLQSVDPIENMIATDTTEGARSAAAALERIYVAWKAEEEFDLKFHKASTVKALYGRTASRIYWDKEDDDPHPCVDVVEQPRNLYLGYKTDSYEDVEWAAYVSRWNPNALAEEYGLEVDARALDETIVPYISSVTTENMSPRPWLNFGPAQIEVWDYWYRRRNKRGKFETWNAVVAGDAIVQGPNRYPEYEGEIPYVPLFNTFIPGVPNGRPELYDMEQLIREKFEKITAGSQMIANGVAGDYWQLIGPEAPTRVPPGLKPKRNELVGPGPGNRIETITPFIAQFQLEQYLGRIDREMATVSGLNDLLLGLAPAQVLSSSKAINALIANYEARLSMRRKLLYAWRRRTWELTVKVWAAKDKNVKSVVTAGGGKLDIQDPSLSPRDEMETSTRASNLVNAKLWSQRRGMDAVGVDDPETEQDMIREERTDATMFPADVQVMAQLMGALQALGLNAPAGAQEQVQDQMASGQSDLRKALGGATPENSTSSQLPGDQGMTPPIPGAPPEAGGAPPPFAAGPGAATPPVMQGMLQEGKTKGRIMTQQTLGRR